MPVCARNDSPAPRKAGLRSSAHQNATCRTTYAKAGWIRFRVRSRLRGDAGGRLYVTCLHILMLEVYYRHLPLFELNEGEKK